MWMMAVDDLVFVLFTETTVSLLQKPFWMTFCLPTLFSCLPVIYVKPSWDNILTTEIVFNLSLGSISSDQHQHLFHSCSIFIGKCNGCWSLNPDSTYCTKRFRGKEDGREALERKRKVLYLVSQWMELCNDFLRDDERVKLFMKVRDKIGKPKAKRGVKIDVSFQTLCGYVLDDLFEHPALEKDVRELQKLYMLHRRQWVTVQCCSFVNVSHQTQRQTINRTLVFINLGSGSMSVTFEGLKECRRRDSPPLLLSPYQWIHSEVEEESHCSRVLRRGVLYCTGCYAMNYECTTLLILKLWEKKVEELTKWWHQCQMQPGIKAHHLGL